MGTTLKGRFKPKHPEKYRGDYTNIIYRSSWERDVMNWLDTRSDVKWWQSEEKCFWYHDKVTKKNRRYFPDFIVCFEREYGEEIRVIEVKPSRQVRGPNPQPKRRTKSWMKEVETYLTNQCKWQSMEEVCENKGWTFQILTEQDIKTWSKRK